MAEEVEITNVGGTDGVASEATLVSLANSMRRLAEQRGLDPRSTESKLIDTSNKARKSNIEIIRDNSEALEENTEEFKENTASVSRFSKGIGIIGAGLGVLTGIVGNFARELLLGGDRLSDFTQHVPLAGGVITPFVQYLEDSLDAFRELSVVGASFGNSMIELRRAALEAGMPLEEFTSLVRDNSTVMAALGSGTSGGAREFARLSKELRSGVGADLMAMGFTITDLNEALINYSDFTNRQIGVDRLNNRNLVQGTANYLVELDKLSRLTGISRKQLQEQINQNQADARVRFARDRMSAEQQLQFDSNLALATEKSQAFGNILSDMVDGRPDEELSRRLFSMSSVFRENAANIKDMDAAEFLKFSNDLTDEIERLGLAYGDSLEGLMNADPVFREMFGLQYELSDLRRLTAQDIQNMENERRRRDRITSELAKFEESIRNIRTAIQEQLINSGIFTLLTESISSVASLINSPEGMAAIKTAIEDITLYFTNFINEVQDVGLWQAVKNAFMDGFSSIWKEAKLFLFGGVRDYTTELEQTQNRLDTLNAQRSEIIARGARSEANPEGFTMEELNVLNAQMERLRSERSRLQQEHGTEVEGLFEGAFSNLFGQDNQILEQLEQERRNALAEYDNLFNKSQFETLTDQEAARMAELQGIISELDQQIEGQEGLIGSILGDIDGTTVAIGTAVGVGLVGALYLLGTALRAVALPIAAVGVGIGAGATGLGYLVGELSDLFDGLGTTITNVFSTIPATIEAVGNAIGTVIDKITAYNTAATQAETTQITELSNLNAENINLVASAVEKLKTALTDYPTPGIFTSLISFATDGADTEIMNSITTQITTLANALSPLDSEKLISASSGITAMGDSLIEFAKGLAAQSASGILESIAGWFSFGDDGQSVVDKIVEFGNAFASLNGQGIVQGADGLTALANSIAALNENEVSSFSWDGRTVNRIERLGAAGPNLEKAAAGLKGIAEVTGLQENLQSISNLSLDIDNIYLYADAIEELVAKLEELNETLAETVVNRGRGRETLTTGQVLTNIDTASQTTAQSILGLNTTMQEILTVLRNTKEIETQIERNTSAITGNVNGNLRPAR